MPEGLARFQGGETVREPRVVHEIFIMTAAERIYPKWSVRKRKTTNCYAPLGLNTSRLTRLRGMKGGLRCLPGLTIWQVVTEWGE